VVATVTVDRAEEVSGINSRSELAEVSRMARQQKNEELMAAGVTLIDPATAYIDAGVEIGADTVVHPFVCIEGSTRIGAACEIHAGARIVNSTVADRATILNHSVIVDSAVGEGCRVGPFAHLRPGASLGKEARVGNFVELKKTTMGPGAKANHLAYLGDSTIGPGANIGAGTITCNYDGVAKHQTTVGAGAFVGSNSTLVAPVAIGDGAYVAAGSAITEDVPANALGLGRARQVMKPDWAARRRDAASKPDQIK
jgi:bifunctional UDP-N-acetylglucosamine pyrophosphorylase/glucosamine-1-phosphate N-acetyltransferase